MSSYDGISITDSPLRITRNGPPNDHWDNSFYVEHVEGIGNLIVNPRHARWEFFFDPIIRPPETPGRTCHGRSSGNEPTAAMAEAIFAALSIAWVGRPGDPKFILQKPFAPAFPEIRRREQIAIPRGCAEVVVPARTHTRDLVGFLREGDVEELRTLPASYYDDQPDAAPSNFRAIITRFSVTGNGLPSIAVIPPGPITRDPPG